MILTDNKVNGLKIPNLYIKPKQFKQWYWHMDRHIVKWSRIECSEISLYIYGELVFDKGARAFQCGRRIVFSINVLGHLDWISTCLKKGDLDPYLTPYAKMNSKWVIDLNVRTETIQPLEKCRRKSS